MLIAVAVRNRFWRANARLALRRNLRRFKRFGKVKVILNFGFGSSPKFEIQIVVYDCVNSNFTASTVI